MLFILDEPVQYFSGAVRRTTHIANLFASGTGFSRDPQTFTARPRIYCSDSFIINWLVLLRFFDSCTATCGTNNSFICLIEGLQLPTTRVFLCASLFSSGAGKAVLEFHHNTAKWENPSLHKSNKFTTISSVLKIQLTCPGMRSPVLHSCGSHLSRLCSGTFALACKLL